MSIDHSEKQGQQLRDELEGERRRARGSHRWWCSDELRFRAVRYAVACSLDGESHGRIADRLGLTGSTLSRWVRDSAGAGSGLREVAIVPATRQKHTACSTTAPPPTHRARSHRRGPRPAAARLPPAGPQVIGSTRSLRVFGYGQESRTNHGAGALERWVPAPSGNAEVGRWGRRNRDGNEDRLVRAQRDRCCIARFSSVGG